MARPKIGKRPQLQVTVEPELLEAIQREARANFESVSAIVERRLVASFKAGEIPKTESGLRKDQAEQFRLAALEREDMRQRGEIIRMDDAEAVVAADYAQIRQRALHLPTDIPGLSEEQIEAAKVAIENFFTGLTATEAATFDKLSDKFKNEKGI